MQPLKAHVRNGRLLLDEPTDLPEGAVVELVQLDDVQAHGGDDPDDPDDDERDALQRDIEASFDENEAGQLIDLMIDLTDAMAGHRTIR